LPDVPPVTGVQVVSRGERVNPEVLENELAGVPGIDLRRRPETDFSLENLNTRLEQVYGRGEFERMDYRMVDQPGSRTVEVEGVEKAWGPNFLKFGLGMASDNDQTRFTVSASHRMTWLNDLGGEWRNDFSVGYRDSVISQFYQPLSFAAGVFVAPSIDLADEPIVYYFDGERIGEYSVSHARLHLDFGGQNKYGEIRFGMFAGELKAEEDFGLIPGVPDHDIQQVGYRAHLIFDQMSDPNIMRDGYLLKLGTFGTVDDWGSDDNYNKTELLFVGAREFGAHGFQLAGYWGDSLDGEMPAYDPFLLGGFMRGSGYGMDELLGNEVAMVRGVYTYKVASLPSPLGSGVYLGGSVEATRATLGIDPSADKQVRPSASVFVSADTFLGPAYLSWGKAFDDDDAPSTFYLLFGKP
jgi:NTE family protein